MNLLRLSVLVAAIVIARYQAKDEPPPAPPPDDSLLSLTCSQCQICWHSPNPPTCFAICCPPR